MPSTILSNHPLDVRSIDESEALDSLDTIGELLPSEKLAEVPLVKEGRALVVGDTHGDWPTLQALVEKYLLGANRVDRFIILGDYVDRVPSDLLFASVTNALYVLSLRALFPERVLIFRGNHEAYQHVPYQGHDIIDDSFRCWGTRAVGEKIEDLFDRLPIAGITENGAYLAHAGFPIVESWRDAILHPTYKTWLQVLWNDVDVSPTCGGRGIDQEPIGSANLSEFLASSGTSVFLRGHDPHVVGELLYDKKLLTVHTTRGRADLGVMAAIIPLGERMSDLSVAQIITVDIPPIPPMRE
jgi:hypothetical protein